MLLKFILLFGVFVYALGFRIVEHQASDPICVEADCDEDELCVVEGGQGMCVSRNFALHNGKYLPEKTGGHRHEKCSHAELHQIGGRLLEWFGNIHRHNNELEMNGVNQPLAHTLPCRPEVAWMFQQWDGDANGRLTKVELIPVMRGGQEHCVDEFIGMCDDIEVDGEISSDEWCDCFEFADDQRHEPPCHKAKHGLDPHIHKVDLPRCDESGYFLAEQCDGRECWCADKWGREMPQSRVRNEEELDCGQYATHKKNHVVHTAL